MKTPADPVTQVERRNPSTQHTNDAEVLDIDLDLIHQNARKFKHLEPIKSPGLARFVMASVALGSVFYLSPETIPNLKSGFDRATSYLSTKGFGASSQQQSNNLTIPTYNNAVESIVSEITSVDKKLSKNSDQSYKSFDSLNQILLEQFEQETPNSNLLDSNQNDTITPPFSRPSPRRLTEKTISTVEQQIETLEDQPGTQVSNGTSVPKLPSRKQLARIVSQFVLAYENGDMELLDELLADNISKEETKRMYGDLFSSSTSRQIHINDVHWNYAKKHAKGVGRMRSTIVGNNDRTSIIEGKIQIIAKKFENNIYITHLYHTEHEL